jgi:hypothetical protein
MEEWNSSFGEGEKSASRPDRFAYGEISAGTNWIGAWVGPRAGLNAVEKTKIPESAWNRTPAVQPVVHHYAD